MPRIMPLCGPDWQLKLVRSSTEVVSQVRVWQQPNSKKWRWPQTKMCCSIMTIMAIATLGPDWQLQLQLKTWPASAVSQGHRVALLWAFTPPHPPTHPPHPTTPQMFESCVYGLMIYYMTWYCLIQPDTAWYCLILPDTAWYCLILPDTAWYCLILPDTAWYYLILPDTNRYCLILTDTAWSFGYNVSMIINLLTQFIPY